MGVPYGSVNSQVVTSAANVLIPSGAIINLNAIMWIERQGVIVKIKMRDGTNFDQRFTTETLADAFLQQLVAASNPATIGAPYIQSITPNTAVAGTPIVAVVKGQGFEPLGQISIGADTCVYTFVDSFTILVDTTGTTPPATVVSVVYTAPDAVTTATLLNGFTWS